jgi:hypothetical protein
LNQEKKPWGLKSHLADESRPESRQRFPSRDIWEDTPDSLQLQTTVGGPQVEEKDVLSRPEDRPTTGAVAYHQEKAAAGYVLGSEEGRATTGIAATMKPHVPARPQRTKPTESLERQPVVPERPSRLRHVDSASPPIPVKSKPQVPTRPPKPVKADSSENVLLTKVPSGSSAKSVGSEQAAAAKPKPPVPSRPVGSKIAALQGGFMSDLNKRLQLGPQAPKKEEAAPEEPEVEKEKVPLADARKGRARGPARRAPAKSPTPVTETAANRAATTLGVSVMSTLWHIDPEEDLLRITSSEDESSVKEDIKATESETPTLATNLAGEKLHEASEIALDAAKQTPPTATQHILAPAEQKEEAEEKTLVSHAPDEEPESSKPSEEDLAVSQEAADGEEELSASTTRVKDTESVVE